MSAPTANRIRKETLTCLVTEQQRLGGCDRLVFFVQNADQADSTTIAETLHRESEVRSADDIHDKIHADTARKLERFLGPVGVLAVVDQMSGSKLTSEL